MIASVQHTPGLAELAILDWRTGAGVSVVSTAVSPGDANCPDGGIKFNAVNGVTYACNGASGQGGSRPILWAKVAADGTLIAGNGVVRVSGGGGVFAGVYAVDFDRDIDGCARRDDETRVRISAGDVERVPEDPGVSAVAQA